MTAVNPPNFFSGIFGEFKKFRNKSGGKVVQSVIFRVIYVLFYVLPI